MHAALRTASGVVAEGLPGAGVRPAHARRRPARPHPAAPAGVAGVLRAPVERLATAGPGRSWTTSSTTWPRSTRRARRSRRRVRVPAALHGDLRAARRARSRAGRARRGLIALLVPTPTPAEYARAKEASDAVVAQLGALRRPSGGTRRRPRQRADRRPRRRRAARRPAELLSTIFQLIVAGHDTTTSLIGNAVVALLDIPTQLDAAARRAGADPAAIEELLRFDAPGAPLHVPLRGRAGRDRRRDDPGGRAGDHLLRRRQPRPGRYTTPDGSTSNGPKRRHLAFGHGIHHCLGAPLARIEGQIALAVAPPRFPAASPRRRPRPSSTGVMATGSCCGACPSCRSSPVPRRRTRHVDHMVEGTTRFGGGDANVGHRLPGRGGRRDGHGLHRRADRPRRRARDAGRPPPRRRRALAGRVSVRAAAPGVAVLRRRVDGARTRRACSRTAPRRGCRSGPAAPRSRPTSTTSSTAASSAPGRVTFLGGSEYHADGSSHLVTSLVSGETVRVDVRRRVVDATYLSPTIPATTPPPFGVADGVRVVPINELARLAAAPEPAT